MTSAARSWSAYTRELEGGRVLEQTLHQEGRVPSWSEVVERWRDDGAFRAFFVELLGAAPFEALLWETPPLTRATATRPYEQVLVASPALARMVPEPEAFGRELVPATDEERAEGVVAFTNLGGDALLVAPTPRGPRAAYPHLAAFSRAAPDEQRHALWRAVATRLEGLLGERPVWVSTSGLGVAWLHVRLDDRPKYVTHAPYRHG